MKAIVIGISLLVGVGSQACEARMDNASKTVFEEELTLIAQDIYLIVSKKGKWSKKERERFARYIAFLVLEHEPTADEVKTAVATIPHA